MKKYLLLLALLFSVTVANADQFTWAGTNNSNSGIEARLAYQNTIEQVMPASERKLESFEGKKWKPTFFRYGQSIPQVRQITSKGLTWYKEGAYLATFDSVVRIHRKKAFSPASDNSNTRLDPMGYTIEVANFNKKLYGTCASFNANIWSAKLEFVLDDHRYVDFEGNTRLYNPNYYDTDEYPYPIVTLCFIDTEGFQKLTIQTVKDDPQDDEYYAYISDWFDFAGPINYTPDFSSLSAPVGNTDKKQRECEEEGNIWDGEDCKEPGED